MSGSLFPLRRVRVLWHPDSPGMHIPVRTLWWRKRTFATLNETLRYYRALELVRAGGPASGKRDA